LEQVVRGDVGLVADGHEAGEAEPALGRLLEQRKAERPTLRREADPAGWQEVRSERRVETRARRDHAEAVGADETCAVRPHEGEQLVLALASFRPDLREP